jgi:hypothetical protein
LRRNLFFLLGRKVERVVPQRDVQPQLALF